MSYVLLLMATIINFNHSAVIVFTVFPNFKVYFNEVFKYTGHLMIMDVSGAIIK